MILLVNVRIIRICFRIIRIIFKPLYIMRNYPPRLVFDGVEDEAGELVMRIMRNATKAQ